MRHQIEISSVETDALLAAVRAGDTDARNQLIERTYPEFRRLARHMMALESASHQLDAEELVAQLWLRLLAPKVPGEPAIPQLDLHGAQNLQHLLSFAAHNMRKILVDYSRMSKSVKSPKRKDKVDTERISVFGREIAELSPDALDVHNALQKLEPVSPEAALAIELRYFLGFTNEEGAATMGIPLIQFRRHCDMGKSFLRNELLARKSGGLICKESASGEKSIVEQEVRDFFPNSDAWLETPNYQLGGRRPKELIGTKEEVLVRDLIRAIKYIGIS